jgi:hypothetical protein
MGREVAQGKGERTFGWLSRNRRMCKDYERKVQTSETLIAMAMIRLLLARQGRRAAVSVLGGKQLPVPLGNDFDGAVSHFDGGLIVDRVRWYG